MNTNHRNMVQLTEADGHQAHVPQERQKLSELFSLMIREAAAEGYGEYRTHIHYMDTIIRDVHTCRSGDACPRGGHDGQGGIRSLLHVLPRQQWRAWHDAVEAYAGQGSSTADRA